MSKFSKVENDIEKEKIILSAHESIVCKLSAISKKYYSDSLLPIMFNRVIMTSNSPAIKAEKPKKPPIINRGYYARVHCIKETEKLFIETFNGPKQIVYLGSGYETNALSILKEKSNNDIIIYEIDYPEVLKKKIEIIQGESNFISILNPTGAKIDNSPIDTKSLNNYLFSYEIGNINFIGSDLGNFEIVLDLLKSRGFQSNIPTLIVTECVQVYLPRVESLNLCTKISEIVNENSFWVSYDMFGANDIYGKNMLKNLSMRGLKIPGFLDFPTLKSQEERFLSTGFKEVFSCSMLQYYNNMITKKEKIEMGKLEIFDEFEEWDLLMNHYSFTIASKGFNNPLYEKMKSLLQCDDNNIGIVKIDKFVV